MGVALDPESASRPHSSWPRRVRVVRIGLVLAALMGFFNTLNGTLSLLDPSFGQTDPADSPQPTWISVVLLVCGAVTLAAVVPAWRWIRAALIAVVGSRLVSAWSAVALPFLPDAPDGIAIFAAVLVVVGTTVSWMVAQGLRSSSHRPATDTR